MAFSDGERQRISESELIVVVPIYSLQSVFISFILSSGTRIALIIAPALSAFLGEKAIIEFVIISVVPPTRRSSAFGHQHHYFLFLLIMMLSNQRTSAQSISDRRETGQARKKTGRANHGRHALIYFPPVQPFRCFVWTIHHDHQPSRPLHLAYS